MSERNFNIGGERIETDEPADEPAVEPEDFSDVGPSQDNGIDSLVDAIDDAADRIEEAAEETEQILEQKEYFTYPPGVDPTDLSFLSIGRSSDFLGIITQGANLIDFTKGRMVFSIDRTRDLRRNLVDEGYDAINSLKIRSDDQFIWWLPEINIGSFEKQGSEVILSPEDGYGLGITELIIAAPRMSQINVVGSTSNSIGIDDGIDGFNYSRSSYDPIEQDTVIEVTDEGFEENLITFAPESVAVSPQPLASQVLYADGLESLGITIENRGDNDLHIAAEATNAFGPVPDVPIEENPQAIIEAQLEEFSVFGEIQGWTQADPQVVPAGESRIFEIDPFNYAQMRLRGNVPSGGTTEILAYVSGRST